MPQPTPTTLKRLLDLQRRVSEGRFSIDLLDQAMDCAIGLTHADRGFLVVTGESGRLEIECARGEDRTSLRTADKGISRTLVQKALTERRALCYVNPLDLPEFKDSQSLGVLKLHSIILVPLAAHGVIQGTIVLHETNTRRETRFNERDLQLAEIVAEPAAHALENFLQDDAVEKHITKRLTKKNTNPYPRLIGSSKAMVEFRAKLAPAVNSDVGVLIRGETGTGKEVVARTIFECGKRAKGPFVAVNINAMSDNLVEADLFGHTKGAFTGAEKAKPGHFVRAHGGTIFLDEVGELSLAAQAKLLRVIQEKEVQPLGGGEARKVDVRVIAATHRNLEQRVSQGRFREDLFYRLNVLTITTPSLRDHKEDLKELAQHFLAAFAESEKKPVPTLADDVFAAFEQSSWRGNVRELSSVMYRAVVLEKARVCLEDLNFVPSTQVDVESPRTMMVTLDREQALAILNECHGNRAEAARRMGIARSTFYNRYIRDQDAA